MNIWKLFKNLIYLQRLSVMIDGKGYQTEIPTVVILSLNQSMKAMKNLGRGCLKHLSQIYVPKRFPRDIFYLPPALVQESRHASPEIITAVINKRIQQSRVSM